MALVLVIVFHIIKSSLEIVRRKWDSLKGYYSRKAQRNPNVTNVGVEKDPKANGTTNNEDDASDAVHWAYFERLSFLATSLSRINPSEAGSDEENECDYVQSEPLNLEFSNGSTTIKSIPNTGKRRKCIETPATENGETQVCPIPILTNADKAEISAIVNAPNNQSSNTNAQTGTQPNKQCDPDEFGIGKYVGKVLQDLDADLTDELVSRVVRDCIEVRHKQRLRYAEQFQNIQ